jgi:hypothetical protein
MTPAAGAAADVLCTSSGTGAVGLWPGSVASILQHPSLLPVLPSKHCAAWDVTSALGVKSPRRVGASARPAVEAQGSSPASDAPTTATPTLNILDGVDRKMMDSFRCKRAHRWRRWMCASFRCHAPLTAPVAVLFTCAFFRGRVLASASLPTVLRLRLPSARLCGADIASEVAPSPSPSPP